MPESGKGKTVTPESQPYELTVTRTMMVRGESGKPALEMELVGDSVRVTLLPRNSSSRERVPLLALYNAVCVLRDGVTT